MREHYRGTNRAAKRYVSMAALACLALAFAPGVASAQPVALSIKIIDARSDGNSVDPRLKELARELATLKFTSYQLIDEATLKLEVGSSGRMQLPNGHWMVLKARELSKDGKVRLDLEVKKLKFKTTVSVGPGATLAVGGPSVGEGSLILAVTHLKAKDR